MKVNNYEIIFVIDTYADELKRKAVLAYTTDGKYYGDVTINIPFLKLNEDESFLSMDCPELINEMIKNGYLEITKQVMANYGIYSLGKFTQKFLDEFEKVGD